ncbi:hypothetical protein Z043_120093 [Scleropages formosus]|uniref:Uncharacterized protein n=1 Tax=Scleropages formosus TaxID=113540 RepID=A0A0P7UQL1_SCLFO|nr:hypothetical protein Z043_120093 [Scleropages formosus]
MDRSGLPSCWDCSCWCPGLQDILLKRQVLQVQGKPGSAEGQPQSGACL